MNLTFKGFLRLYCRELTELQTDNLRKLIHAAATTCPAAAEAVMLYAAMQEKHYYAAGLAQGTWMEENYKSVVEKLEQYENVLAYLESKDAPERYKKVLAAYHAQKNAVCADRRVVLLMRTKTLSLLNESHTSIYSIYKQLGLNKGNLYAYLNKGDASKVSRTTARRILQLSESLATESAS